LAFVAVSLVGIAGLAVPMAPRRSVAQAAPAPAAPTPVPASAAPASAPLVDDGMVTIESDSQQADNATGVVTATGNVRITYPGRGMVATARQAQYYSREGRLVLSGDVDVTDSDGQRIRAERIIYRLDRERIVAEPQAGRQVTSRLKLRQQGSQPPAPRLP
jgi:lipopolysaccharide export system protein LptA